MKKSKMPSCDELRTCGNRKRAEVLYNVTKKTITRWMKCCGLYVPKYNYGCNKLGAARAKEMRLMYSRGVAIKELALHFGVTYAAACRVVRNVTYKDKEVAQVSVVYNHSADSGASGG